MPAFIPHGAYWASPFARWQGSLAHLHSLRFGAHVSKAALAARGIDPACVDYGVLGQTVPQRSSFYGLPWLTGLMGAGHVTGPTVNQACATGARILAMAAAEVREGDATVALAVSADRCSNGPHVFYPAPSAPGGTGEAENWVMDNFGHDPHAKNAMIDTAENVATREQFSTEQQHEVVLTRHAQYQDALKDGAAFLKRFMALPFAVPDARFRKTLAMLEGDEGIHPTTAEGLAALRPVQADGTVTYGGQTHPADGVAGAIIVGTAELAAELAQDPGIRIKILATGQGREEPGYMPAAPIKAARRALERAGLAIDAIDIVKTHNPFAVNDLALSRHLGIDWRTMNPYGSSLIWGHPQGPTGLRAVIELIEALVIQGGGLGLFTGCAAGDSAMAMVLRVADR